MKKAKTAGVKTDKRKVERPRTAWKSEAEFNHFAGLCRAAMRTLQAHSEERKR